MIGTERDLRGARRSKELAESERIARKWGMQAMADGLFYHDTRTPFISSDIASVTLSTTDKALYPAAAFPNLGGQYWAMLGKKMLIHLCGRTTTAATPGNLTFDVYYGSGADATGTIIASSAAQAMTANQTNLTWHLFLWIHCRSTGATGTLFCDGYAMFNEAVIAPKMMIPASAPAVSGSLDLTAANIISVQAKRSGSTAETMQVHDIDVSPLN
jgi:hypothetical protein